MQIVLNDEDKDGSQAMSSEIIRVFMDKKIKSSAIPLGRLACSPGEIESTPYQLS